MVVVKIELWPKGDEKKARPLGTIIIANNATGDAQHGNYDVSASHAGIYYGKRKEPYKTAKVTGFPRKWSPYKLVAWALKALREA